MDIFVWGGGVIMVFEVQEQMVAKTNSFNKISKNCVRVKMGTSDLYQCITVTKIRVFLCLQCYLTSGMINSTFEVA